MQSAFSGYGLGQGTVCVVDASAVDQVALPLPVVGVEVRERVNPAPVSLRIASDVRGTTFGKR